MHEKSHSNVEISLARPEDRDVVISLFLELLQFLDSFDNDMLPTLTNAELMADQVFMPAAAAGEPVLIAWEGKKPIGAVFWVLQKLPYQARWITAYGYGTYLKEGYRNQKLGTEIRNHALKILKAKGVQKLIGMVILKNKASLIASDRYGFVPFARIDFLELT